MGDCLFDPARTTGIASRHEKRAFTLVRTEVEPILSKARKIHPVLLFRLSACFCFNRWKEVMEGQPHSLCRRWEIALGEPPHFLSECTEA
jgi:hypothetical protein